MLFVDLFELKNTYLHNCIQYKSTVAQRNGNMVHDSLRNIDIYFFIIENSLDLVSCHKCKVLRPLKTISGDVPGKQYVNSSTKIARSPTNQQVKYHQ